MKTLVIATAIALGATAATAADFGLRSEYGIEADAFTTTLSVGQDIGFAYVSAAAEVVDTDFTGVDLGASYGLTENVTLYGVVEVDADFGHEETTIGVSFQF